MTPLIDQAVATNIAGHTKKAYTYSKPNDDTAEIILTQGLLPFYSNTEQRGGSMTIVDVKVDHVALDVKSRDKLTFLIKKPSDKQLQSGNKYYQLSNAIWVKIPNNVLCPVRRPKTNTQGYQGSAKTAILDQIQEYSTYATRTMTAASCTEIHTILFLYGEGNGYKGIYIEEQDFYNPAPTSFGTKYNKKNNPTAYEAFDNAGKLLYYINDYSKGSTNFNKRFDLQKGYLFVWPSFALTTSVTTPKQWSLEGNFSMNVGNHECQTIYNK
jgi:hypothetical protein